MSDQATVNIPKDVLEPIIQAQVTKAIIEAMAGRDNLIEKAVAFFMNVKVDEKGNISQYRSQNETPWINWAIMQEIQAAAKLAIKEILASHGELLKKQLVKQLSVNNSPLLKHLAEKMVSGCANAAQHDWNFKVEVNTK